MGFNNMVNVVLIISGIIDFLGTLGGVLFLVVFIIEKIEDYQFYKADSKPRCETCLGYNACFGAFGGQLPEDGCAYYKNDEEVEISVN